MIQVRVSNPYYITWAKEFLESVTKNGFVEKDRIYRKSLKLGYLTLFKQHKKRVLRRKMPTVFSFRQRIKVLVHAKKIYYG